MTCIFFSSERIYPLNQSLLSFLFSPSTFPILLYRNMLSVVSNIKSVPVKEKLTSRSKLVTIKSFITVLKSCGFDKHQLIFRWWKLCFLSYCPFTNYMLLQYTQESLLDTSVKWMHMRNMAYHWWVERVTRVMWVKCDVWTWMCSWLSQKTEDSSTRWMVCL